MYYKQPKYFSEFKCIGSECAVSCCYGWTIDWTKDEIDKITNAPNCSAELRELVEKTFIPKDANYYKVKFREDGFCPLVTEEGLCRIQKELGAEYLSKTCMVYPRYNAFVGSDNAIYRGSRLSCKEVLRLLVTEEKAMELVSVPDNEHLKEVRVLYADSNQNISAHPELKYRREINEFFFDLIGDKKCSLETNIVLGALAAQKLTQFIENKQYDQIPDALKSFRKQIHNASALKSIDNIKPNYNIKLGVVEKIINKAMRVAITGILKNENGELELERYLVGEARLAETMKPFWLRNIALNMLLELCIPFKSLKHTVFENYRFFVAGIACLKLNAIAASLFPEDLNIETKGLTLHLKGIDKIYGTIGLISRSIFQTGKAFDSVNTVLDAFNMKTPAYLALLVK